MPSSSAVVAVIASTLLLCATLLVLLNDPSAPEGAPALTTTTKLSASSGHCNFDHACWPDKSTWDHFSQSLGAGVLRTVADIDTVHAECQAGIAAHGGAGLAQFVANGTCILGGVCVYENCTVGNRPNLPVYSVAATEVRHVQAAIDFARTHNIRLSIKSTGAGYALGEQQPNSILVWMSNYQRSTTEGIIENFKPCSTSHGPALKIGGGETWGQVFEALVVDGRYMMSSGAAVTVGGSGGWLQGGGLGPLDRRLGLGVDNVLQFDIVTADGQLKVANECSEPDLYWALRGGGGGNLGVVVSQTSRVHPIQPVIRLNLNWRGSNAWSQGVEGNVAQMMPGIVLRPGMQLPMPWAVQNDRSYRDY